jgi:hypothetical protein
MGEQGSSLPSFPWGNKGVTGASFLCFHSRCGGDWMKLGAGATEDARQIRVEGRVAWQSDTDASERTSGSGGRLARRIGDVFGMGMIRMNQTRDRVTANL